jgi:7-cyano-7-deazaguanine synthase
MQDLTATDSVGVLFSGGLDSAILLGHLTERGHAVHPLYIDSGLNWQRAELAAAREYCAAIARQNLRPLVVLSLPLNDLYGDHWSITGSNVPAADSPDEAVYLLGRNPLLLIKARLWCQVHSVQSLAIGCLGNNPFADATEHFFAQFAGALDQATGTSVKLMRPLAGFTKRQVMQLGEHYPLALTFSCIAPRQNRHCGRCNKCGERQTAFAIAGLTDPTEYAEPVGLVGAGQVLEKSTIRL